ncbi:hypothetical protein, partial [Rhodoferax sp.]|uniref:hypothetical protein n=1 Tax=Rhodoferax sp. TaxID=50421 RepID=UPI0025ECDA3E
HTLSPKAAAQVLAFLEALSENFMAKYDAVACRHYAQRDKARRNLNGSHIGTIDESWRADSNGKLF